MTKHKESTFISRINNIQTQIALLSLTVAALQAELKDIKACKMVLVKDEPLQLNVKPHHFDDCECIIVDKKNEELEEI